MLRSPKWSVPFSFLTEILYAFFISSIHITCLAHCVLGLISLIVLCKNCKIWNLFITRFSYKSCYFLTRSQVAHSVFFLWDKKTSFHFSSIVLTRLKSNMVVLCYYAGLRRQNEDLCYQHRSVFWEILQEIIFFIWKFLFITNLISNYSKKLYQIWV